MAITPTLLTSGQDTDESATATTASITPTSNRPVLAVVFLYHSGTDGLTSISGAGLTWTARASLTLAGDTSPEVHFWTGVAASPSAGALTITPVNTTVGDISWAIIDLVDGSSTPWVGNSDTNEGTGTTATATLASFADAANCAIAACWMGDADTMEPTGGSGYTEITQLTTFGGGFNVVYRADNGNLTPSVTLGASALWGVLAAEFADGSAPAPSASIAAIRYNLSRQGYG